MIIKHIDVISAGKISGIIAAAIGLLAGVIFFLFSSVFGALLNAAGNSGGSGALGMIGGVAGIIILPVLYGIFGFIGGMLQAFIYNLAAGFVGGIRFDTE